MHHTCEHQSLLLAAYLCMSFKYDAHHYIFFCWNVPEPLQSSPELLSSMSVSPILSPSVSLSVMCGEEQWPWPDIGML